MPRRLVLASLLAFFATLVTSVWVQAQTPAAQGADFQVNTYTTGEQRLPAVAAGPDDGWIVVWHSAGSPGDDTDNNSVQGQRFASNGDAIGGQFQVNTYTTSYQERPSVAVAPDGEFVIVWESGGSSGSDTSLTSVQGQRYASDGTPVGGQFQVNTYTTSLQFGASVATGPDGGFVVAWSSAASPGDDPNISVQGRRYASDGNPIGGQFQVNTYTMNSQNSPSVGIDSDGDFAVVWQSLGSDGGDTSGISVQGQLYASTGDALGGQFQVNTYTPLDQDRSSVAMGADGGFVVAWQSNGSDGDDSSFFSIQARRFASDGTALGSEVQVNSYTTSAQLGPTVSVGPEGDFLVFWESSGSPGDDSDSFSIQGQRFAANGDPLGSQFQVNSYTTGLQGAPSAAIDSRGDFVVAWSSDGSSGDDSAFTSVQSRRFRTTGDVGDRVWRDEDADGVQDGGEIGVSGVAVEIFDDQGGLVDSTVTDLEGEYLFEYVPSGDHVLVFDLLAGYEFTLQDAAGDDTLDSDVDVAGMTDLFPVLPGVVDVDRDAGLIPPRIGDRVWFDTDGNGIQDGPESGAPGVMVSLFDAAADTLLGQAITDGDGHYAIFAEAGDVYLEFDLPDGYAFTARDVGSDDLDSDVSASGVTTVFSFDAVTPDDSRDAGLVSTTAQVGDRVWIDANANGVQNGGEVGLEGVEVRLFREPDPPLLTEAATLEDVAVTDVDGHYSFVVDPGTFYLEFACSLDAFTARDQGGDDALDSDVEPTTGTTLVFGLAPTATDGSQDAGLLDPDLDGVACMDNCPDDANADQSDSDEDGSGDPCDLCAGDDAGGDGDNDGLCADSPYECDDGDATNACAPIFDDGFESGDTSAWSATVG